MKGGGGRESNNQNSKIFISSVDKKINKNRVLSTYDFPRVKRNSKFHMNNFELYTL